MFAHVEHPQTLSSTDLDQYLAKGWFRLNQTIFTTNFLQFKRNFYSAIWLRTVLRDFSHDRFSQKLFRRNSVFDITIQPATLTKEKEDLFAVYRKNVSFESSTSLQHLLFGKFSYNVYHTYEVTIHDKDRLIGVGFFDLGENSAAGISSFYHPDYRKFSLGKFLIYCKILYCKEIGMDYFYPGYFVPGYAPFDYKLTIARSALQYLDVQTSEWLPINDYVEENAPINIMLSKLNALQKSLLTSGIHGLVYRYEFFDANLIPELKGMELFDFPLFLKCWETNDNEIKPLVVYDVRTQRYSIIQSIAVWKPDETMDINDGIYGSHLLRVREILYTAENVDDIKLKLEIINRSITPSDTTSIHQPKRF